MAIGEFTKYGLVFASSITGAVAGYFYSNRAINLRMKLEKRGKKILRPSDQLWMYARIIKQRQEEIKKVTELKDLTEGTLTEDEKALKLLDWCNQKVTGNKWNSLLESQVATLCEYPS